MEELLTPKDMAVFLRNYKKEIVDAFIGARPYGRPHKRGETDIATKQWLSKRVVVACCILVAKASGVTDVNVLREICEGGKLIYALRTTAYVLKCMWSHDEVINRKHAPLLKCGELVLAAIRPNNRGWNAAANSVQYANMDYLPRFNTAPSTERHTFFHKLLTQAKRNVGTLLTNLVATRWEGANSAMEFRRRVNPDVNFARRLAISVRVINELTELPLMDIVELIDKHTHHITDSKSVVDFDRPIMERAGRVTDADLVFLLSMLTDAGRARFKNKIIEVNRVDCTCQTKCVGEMGKYPELEETFYKEIFTRQTGTIICGFCRLSHSVENTTSQKPRRCINSQNPVVSSCSIEGCTAMKHVSLYALEVEGPAMIRYSHRFYSTNPKLILEEVFGEKKSSTQGRVYGVCFTGYRNCFKKIITKTKLTTDGETQYSEPATWCRCTGCDCVEVFDPDNHNIYLEDINKGTCIASLYQKFKRGMVIDCEIGNMCRGCRSAMLCRHVVSGMVNRVLSGKYLSISVARRLCFTLNVQQKIRELGIVG